LFMARTEERIAVAAAIIRINISNKNSSKKLRKFLVEFAIV